MDEELTSLIVKLAEFSDDPLAFALWAFPWGEPGELEEAELQEWQIKVLEDLRDGLITVDEAVLIARTSGHGIGKSALVAIIVIWAIATREDTKGVITANTENQLKTKTWAELAKWFRLFIGRQLFKMTATAMFSVDPEHEKTWRMDMVPWSIHRTEAFAGLHNKGGRILIIFDEASNIPDAIWEVAEGALTDKSTQIIWVAFGNPTATGTRFHSCFPGGKFAHRWKTATVDSRDVTISNKEQFARWAEDYGEDSDFFRVRVRGLFPRENAHSFISTSDVQLALKRDAINEVAGNLILGVDVGRFGDDPSVLYFRRGLDARTIPPIIIMGMDTMQLVRRIITEMNFYGCRQVNVDVGGVGGGVVDRLNELNIMVYPVEFGGKADNFNVNESGIRYLNKRAEMWGSIKAWLRRGGVIADWPCGENVSFSDELTGPQYSYNRRDSLVLESKDDMKRRGVPSPNVADALCCTFAVPEMLQQETFVPPQIDYNPFNSENIYGR